MKFVNRVVVLSLGLLLLTPMALLSQAMGRGGLSGIVSDSTGAVIPGAKVVLTNTATHVARNGQTTGAGLYSFVGLPPGDYDLKVSAQGFQTAVRSHIDIAIEVSQSINVTMHPGTATQTVNVSAAPLITATTSATTGQLITQKTIEAMPLAQRDVFQLTELTPGITPTNGTLSALDSTRDQVATFSINGAQMGSMYYTLDGSPLTVGENNQGSVIPAFAPPLDAIQEFRVDLSETPASVQSGAAGVISMVSKSGTDNFHGDLFGFLRPNGLDANDSFVKANQIENNEPNKPAGRSREQWGGSIGGPIVKNKLFFFADFEGTNEKDYGTMTTTVPTAAERTGDFSGDKGLTIYNPFPSAWGSANCVAGTTSCPQPFAGNIIAPGSINPVSQAYLQWMPQPNVAPTSATDPYHQNNYFASASSPLDQQKFDVRIDADLSQSQHLFGRYSFARTNSSGPDYFPGDLALAPSVSNVHDFNALIGDDWTLSPTTVLQFRLSATRHNEKNGPQGQFGFDSSTLGFPAFMAQQSVYPDIPEVAFSGNGAAPNLGSHIFSPFDLADTTYDFNVTLNKVVGRHQLSIGWDYQYQYQNVFQMLAPSGWFGFDSSTTASNINANGDDGDAFASFLLGVGAPSQGNQNWTTDIEGANGNAYTAGFIQDNWSVSNTLTLNLGLRWDFFPGATERYNRMEAFNPNLAYTVNGVDLTGGEVFVTPQNRTPFTNNWKDFAPRVGFTYQFLKNAVVRGGFGISYGPSVHMGAINQFDDDSFNAVTLWQGSTTDPSGNYVVPENLLNNPFPNGTLKPTNGSLGPATNLGNSVNTVLTDQPDMSAYNYNFGVQYEFPGQTVVSVAWVGSRGLHQMFSNNVPDLNSLTLGQIAQYKGNLLNMVPYPDAAAITDPTAPWYGATQVPQWVMLMPYPQFSNGNSAGPGGGIAAWGAGWGDSEYNSLQAKVEKRLTNHFTTLASFTWSKTMTDDNSAPLAFAGNDFAVPQNWKDLQLEWALSEQDIPLYVSWEMSYDLPIGTGRAVNLGGLSNFLLGGWTVSSIVTLSDGQPIATPTSGLTPWMNQRVNITGSCAVGAQHTSAQWFNYNCMASPTDQFAPGTAGPVLPGIRTDGTHNLDLSLAKHFPMGEGKDLSLRVAAYNFTNSVQYGYPNVFWNEGVVNGQPVAPNPTDMPNFGQVTYQANTPRQISAELRFTF